MAAKSPVNSSNKDAQKDATIKRLRKEINTMKFYITYRQALLTTWVYAIRDAGKLTTTEAGRMVHRLKQLHRWAHADWSTTRMPMENGRNNARVNGTALHSPTNKYNPVYKQAKKHVAGMKNTSTNRREFLKNANENAENYVKLVNKRPGVKGVNRNANNCG